MKSWFEMLEPRERLVVLAGGAIAVLIVAWSFAWTPLREANIELDITLAQKHGMLADARRLQALGTPPVPPSASAESLVLVVDQTHRAHGLGGTLSRNQPDGEDGIRVTFQRVPFAQLVSWLGALRQGHGIIVISANLDGTQQPGLVNASLVLRRS